MATYDDNNMLLAELLEQADVYQNTVNQLRKQFAARYSQIKLLKSQVSDLNSRLTGLLKSPVAKDDATPGGPPRTRTLEALAGSDFLYQPLRLAIGEIRLIKIQTSDNQSSRLIGTLREWPGGPFTDSSCAAK